MNVLVACEESQEVCKAFRGKGHNAYSCDIWACSGDHPEWHIMEDVLMVLNPLKFYTQDRTERFVNQWDLVISFPPCTHLAVSGARWFDKKRLSGEQKHSIEFFLHIWMHSHAVENPIGIMSGRTYLKKWFPDLVKYMEEINFPTSPSQIIQPWQFGHGETKSTCLWLNGLQCLTPTNVVDGREQRIWKLPPTTDRAKLRSKTFPGIAQAMAEQWG